VGGGEGRKRGERGWREGRSRSRTAERNRRPPWLWGHVWWTAVQTKGHCGVQKSESSSYRKKFGEKKIHEAKKRIRQSLEEHEKR
jgi:hypothetical protein